MANSPIRWKGWAWEIAAGLYDDVLKSLLRCVSYHA